MGAAIVTGVKLVTSLAMAGAWMPPLTAAEQGCQRGQSRHWVLRHTLEELLEDDARRRMWWILLLCCEWKMHKREL